MTGKIIDLPAPTRPDEDTYAHGHVDADKKPNRHEKTSVHSAFAGREDAFGDEEGSEVKYKILTWWQGGLLMVAETISLGILSIPKAIATLGLVPGIIILLATGIIASYTGYVIGQFKLRYPHISSMGDVGEILMGSFGRELLNLAQMLFLVFIMSSHVLTFSTAMNTLTDHGTCTTIFSVIGTVASCILSIPRTLERVSWLSIVSFLSILIASVFTMITLGVLNPRVPVKATATTTLSTGFVAALNIVLSFASHNAFFAFMAELRDPTDFRKSLALLQTIDISLYFVVGVVIYLYAGDDVASPALNSTPPLYAKIAYGLALPTIIIAGVINSHIAAKSIYIRVFAGTDRIHKRDFVAIGSWLGMSIALWILAWVIASAIPVFSNLMGLMSALFASWFTFALPGIYGLFLDRGVYLSSLSKLVGTCINCFCICVKLTLCGLGLYASGKAIHDDTEGGSFSCANNA